MMLYEWNTLWTPNVFLLEPDDSKDVLFSAGIHGKTSESSAVGMQKCILGEEVFFIDSLYWKRYNPFGFFYLFFTRQSGKGPSDLGTSLNCFVSPYWIIIAHLVLLFHVLYHYCTWQYTVGIQTHQSTFLCSGWYCGLCSRQSFLCRDLQGEIQQ